jgi:hypothetical protein
MRVEGRDTQVDPTTAIPVRQMSERCKAWLLRMVDLFDSYHITSPMQANSSEAGSRIWRAPASFVPLLPVAATFLLNAGRI